MISTVPVMDLVVACLPSAFEDRSKRLRGKRVSWPSEDKLCQVRLFVAEDTPSITGIVHQEFYQAKQNRFVHVTVPVLLDDLPPGFEGISANHAMPNAEAISAVVSQIPWHCPAKYVLNPLWQVVAGEESTEVSTQCEQESRVLEAVYPRISTIPPSPLEPVRTCIDVDDLNIPSIPLVPIDDDEEDLEFDILAAGTPFQSDSTDLQDATNSPSPTFSLSQPGENSHKLGSDGSLPTCTAGRPFGSSLLKDADLNAAAAAAAAYAAVTTAESNGTIDHDLLIQILSNPTLLETLSATSKKPKTPAATESITYPACRMEFNPNTIKINGNQSVLSLSESQKTVPVTFAASPDSQKLAASNAQVLKPLIGMGGFNDMNQPSKLMPQSFCQQPISQPLAPATRPLAPRQDYLKELIQQHGTSDDNNGLQTIVVGPRVQPSNKWFGTCQTHLVAVPLCNPRDESGPESMRARPLKPCFYFNTLRGCRHGANCSFLHMPTNKNLERPWMVDVTQHLKRARVESGFGAQESSAAKTCIH